MIYVVFGLLGVTVAVHVVALVFAFSADTDLVREDYYEHGEAWDAELAAVAAGRRLHLNVALQSGVGSGEAGTLAVVAMNDPGVASRPTGGEIVLRRLDEARNDRRLPLAAPSAVDGRLRWQVPVMNLAAGLWLLRVELKGATPLVAESRATAP